MWKTDVPSTDLFNTYCIDNDIGQQPEKAATL